MIKNKPNFPERSGIYLFKQKNKILYVGKAKNLKKRIYQYFQRKNHIQTKNLLQQADHIDYIITDNENDALLIEYNHIQEFRPPFNIRLKDDKSFLYLIITCEEEYPGIYLRRQHSSRYFSFGPLVNAARAKNLIDMLTRLFKIRTCNQIIFKRSSPCLLFHIDQCSAPCIKQIDKNKYTQQVKNLLEFLKGGKKSYITKLKNQMNEYAENLFFEKARQIKDDIETIDGLSLNSYMATPIESDLDVIACQIVQNTGFISLLRIKKGRVFQHSFFNTYSLKDNQEDFLKDFLLSYYQPDLLTQDIIVPFFPADHNNLKKMFSNILKKKLNITIPKKGRKRKMLDLAQYNLSSYVNDHHFNSIGQQLKELCQLIHLPMRIEGIDISHLGERERVGSVVSFCQGQPQKREYRNYKIKTTQPGDTAAIEEILKRRYGKMTEYPDLILIDGGKPQLSVALKIKKQLPINSDIISIAKEEERLYLENGKTLLLPLDLPVLFLLKNIRDESHRRANAFHRSHRDQIK